MSSGTFTRWLALWFAVRDVATKSLRAMNKQTTRTTEATQGCTVHNAGGPMVGRYSYSVPHQLGDSRLNRIQIDFSLDREFMRPVGGRSLTRKRAESRRQNVMPSAGRLLCGPAQKYS
jgi:hypothetical protein